MKRKIEQWKNCAPTTMAREMSPVAIEFAFEDAKSDIISLWEENQKLKNDIRDAGIRGYDEGFESGKDYVWSGHCA